MRRWVGVGVEVVIWAVGIVATATIAFNVTEWMGYMLPASGWRTDLWNMSAPKVDIAAVMLFVCWRLSALKRGR